MKANKRNQPATVSIALVDAPEGFALSGGNEAIEIPALGETKRTAVVIVPHKNYTGRSEIKFHIHANPGDVNFEETIPFLGPDPRSLKSPETP